MSAPLTTQNVKIDDQAKIQPGTIVTDVIGTMRKAGNFNTLITLLSVANLTDLVRSSNALTLFAPTDEAFAKLPKALSIDTLQKPSKRKVLIHLLTYHILPRKMLSSDLQSLKAIKTLNGKRLQVTADQSILSVNGIQLSNVNLQASNGVIHAVDAVLLPPSRTITSPVILVQRVF